MPVPVHLNHHIFVDDNGKATVTNQTISGPEIEITQLNPGDKVTFTSNDPTSQTRYNVFDGPPPAKTQKGSPFGDLPAGTIHKVVTGVVEARVFTVTTKCDDNNHFTFECGRPVNGRFSVWGTPAGVPTGGNTPGPND